MMLGAGKLCSGHRAPAAHLLGVLPWESPGSQLGTIQQCPTAGTALVSKSGLKAAAPVAERKTSKGEGEQQQSPFLGCFPNGIVAVGIGNKAAA